MEIVPGVHRVPGVRGVNVYVLLGGRPAVVDCGMPGSERAILAHIGELGLKPGEVGRVVITHAHVDHIGGLAAVKGTTGAAVAAHTADAPFITGERPQAPPRGALMRLLFRMVPMMSRFQSAPVDELVRDGDVLDLLGGATVVHVPGHTPGSIALHLPAEGVLICGDAINRRGGRLGPPPAPFTADMPQALASVRRLAALNFDVLCPGHGDPLVGGADQQLRAMVQELP